GGVETLRKGSRIRTDLTLNDGAHARVLREDELRWLLDSNHVDRPRFDSVANESSQCRGLSSTGLAVHHDEPSGKLHPLTNLFLHAERVEIGHLIRKDTEGNEDF